MINRESLLSILAFAICYLGWSLLQEEKEILRRVVLLIALVGLFTLTLLYSSFDLLRSRVENLETSFKGRAIGRGEPQEINYDELFAGMFHEIS